MAITVFTKNACPDCEQTKRHLSSKEIDHEVVAADENPEAFDFIVNTLGIRQMPVVILHDGDWRDFRPDRAHEMHQQPTLWSGLRLDRLYGLPKQLAELGQLVSA